MRAVCWLAVVALSGTFHAGEAEEIRVPAGAEALTRYFGLVGVPPEEAGRAINDVLLSSVRGNHEASTIPERVALLDYLETMAAIEKRFTSRITLDGTADWRETYVELSKVLGFNVDFAPGDPALQPRAGDRTQNRRNVAQALGWDLSDIGRRLRRDEVIELSVEAEPIPPPHSAELWAELTGRPFDAASALEVLARDQRLGLMIAGLYRLDRETTQVLRDERLLSWLYGQAPIAFYRYAAALEIRGGNLRVPGGEATREAWTTLVGVSPETPVPFVQQLLSQKGGRFAYLWHALFFQPDDVAAFYILGPEQESQRRSRLAELFRVVEDIDEIAAFSAARGTGPGLGTLMRSVPIDRDAQRLSLPGGTKVWSEALDGTSTPKQAAALDKAAAKWSGKDLPDTVFLKRTLKSDVELGPFRLPVLPRLTRVIHLFGDDLELLTPQNVILLTRSADRFPMALTPLETLTPRNPDVIRDYMLAVRQVEALDHGPEKYVLTATFQGGVELLRLLWQSGNVDHGLLEEHLHRWSQIHQTDGNLHGAAPRQLAWLTSLLESLPPAPEEAPGRGSLERALLWALVARRDPQAFSWKGLDYEGHRKHDVAEGWLRHLEVQGIPPADRLVAIHAHAVALREAMSAADLEHCHRIAGELAEVILSLPPAEVEPPLEGGGLRPWYEAIDRPELQATVESLSRATKAHKLPKQTGKVDRIERKTARELRSFLLAPAYLEGLADLDGASLEGSSLIRKHSPIRYVESSTAILGDSAWGETEMLPGRLSPAGTLFVGHLGGLTRALADYHFIADTTGSRTPLTEHLRAWFDDAASTPWHRLTPEVSARVAELIAAGDGILDEATKELSSDGGPSLDHVSRIVPRARFERFVDGLAPLAPSERLLVGISASETGSPPEIDIVGVPTPAIDGQSRRSIRPWPPYETLESEGVFDAVVERQVIDLRLAVVLYLGRNGLPGEVGADLMQRTLSDLPARLCLRTRFDWESFLFLMQALDDAYFDGKMRQCLADGLYTAQGF